MNVRQTAASSTVPAFAESKRHDRNPEQVPSVEGANLHGTAVLCAGEAVVIAKSDSLGSKIVDAVNDEQWQYSLSKL